MHSSEKPKLFYQGAPELSMWRILFSKEFLLLVWEPLLFWLICWAIIETLANILPKESTFHKFTEHMDEHKEKIQTITVFVLSFFVNSVFNRWIKIYEAFPWPDAIAVRLRAMFNKQEDVPLMQTAMRHILLAQALTYMWISPHFCEHYPNLQSLIDANLLTFAERTTLNRCYLPEINECSYWTPIVWFQQALHEASRNGRISAPMAETHLYDIFALSDKFRNGLGSVLLILDKNVPRSYLQIINFLVCLNLIVTIFGSHSNPNSLVASHLPDPIFSLVINSMIVGLFRASQAMLYPLGYASGDGSNFDLVSVFERNVRVVKLMVQCPEVKESDSEEDLIYEKPETKIIEKKPATGLISWFAS